MSYTAIYRNNNPVQFGTVILTLYLEDTNRIMPDIRHDLKLRYPEQLTESALQDMAQQQIDIAVAEYEQSILPAAEVQP